MMRVNVDGPQNAVRAAAAAGIERVVLTSSAASLGEEEGTVGTEDSPHRGSYLSVYDRSKHEGELAAFAAARPRGGRAGGGEPVLGAGPRPHPRHRRDRSSPT